MSPESKQFGRQSKKKQKQVNLAPNPTSPAVNQSRLSKGISLAKSAFSKSGNKALFSSSPSLSTSSSRRETPLNIGRVSSNNPRFKTLRNRDLNNMSRSTLSQNSIGSRMSGDVGLSGDQKVQMMMQAKSKGKSVVRRKGEVLGGPSVAMARHHTTSSPGKSDGIFKKFRFAGSKLFRSKGDTTSGSMAETPSNKQKKASFPKTDKETKLIIESLQQIVSFGNLSEKTLHALADNMTKRNFDAGQVVFKAGEFGEEMYIIIQGECLVSEDSKGKEGPQRSQSEKDAQHLSLSDSVVLREGNAFGELGMHYGSPRERTVSTLTACAVFVLHRDMYAKIVENEYRIRNELMFSALNKVKILDRLKPEQLKELMHLCELVAFPAGTTIIKKGTIGGTFYMIVKGTVESVVYETIDEPQKISTWNETVPDHDGSRVTRLKDEYKNNESTALSEVGAESTVLSKKKRVKKTFKFSAGQYFGERAYMSNDFTRKADVVATTDVELLVITYDTISKHLDGLVDAFADNIRKQALEDTPFFDSLSKDEVSKVLQSLEEKEFSDGEVVFSEGSMNSSFYIIRDGEAEVKKRLDNDEENDFDLATLHSENYFGEGSLLFEQPTNATVVAKGHLSCYVLNRDDFKTYVKNDTLTMLQHTFNARNRKAIVMKRERTNALLAKINLPELKMHRTLGSGCFGLVKLVGVPKMESFFALKILEKGTVVRNNQELNVLNEKRILLESDHPFIVRLYRTFKDKKFLYFLMEFIQGGEMFQFLHHERGGHLDNDTARFFIACVVDALDYLHNRRIVYRDLKPENLMIDKDGYAKIVDFGFAKKLLYKTFTLCGTAQYLAPEILFNKGYGRSVDFWCLGILIYELFTGTTPFKRPNRNELFKAIKSENRIKFNRRWKNADEAKELVCLLLHKHPKKRLGSMTGGTRGFKEVKAHKWFNPISFEKLFFKELPPPWIPEIKSAKDATHFETYDEDDNPLTGKYDDRAGGSELWAEF